MGISGTKCWTFRKQLLSVLAAFLTGMGALPQALTAQDLVGANEALVQITESLGKHAAENADDDAAGAGDDIAELLKRFNQQKPNLSAEDAATRWLEIYDAWCDSSSDPSGRFGYSSGQSGFALLVGALPLPSHWSELSAQIAARQVPTERVAKVREHALRMLGYRLTGQAEELKSLVADTRTLLAESDPKPAAEGVLGMIGQAFSYGAETNDWKMRSLTEAFNGLSAMYLPEARLESFERLLENVSPESGYFAVPDLVKLAGEERARELLKKILVLEDVSIYFEDAGKTEDLARTVARGMLDEIRQPHWQLCNTLECIEMYEAFAKLGVKENNDYQAYTAGTWYVSALIVAGRGDDVVTFIEQQMEVGERDSGRSLVDSLESQLIDLLEESQHSDAVYQFLVDALQRSPGLPLWRTFAAVAARKGKIDEMLEIVESQLESDGLSVPARQRMQKIRGDTLLAADRVEDAVEQYLPLIQSQSTDAGAIDAEQQFEISVRLAEVGRLLDRQEWIQTGVSVAKQLLDEDANADLQASEFVAALIRLRRYAEAESMLVDRIARKLATEASSTQNDSYYSYSGFGDSNTVSGMLSSLVRVYHAAGRHQDVLSLLNDAPWWNKKDLSGLVRDSAGYSRFFNHSDRPVPIGYIAANALAEAGRVAEAQAICEALLFRSAGYDPIWALQLKLSDDFENFANKIFAQDRFEERPLIWLARYHFDHGDTAKADVLIRRAIKIDPSDGEQGRQNRMRAYTIFAEILQAQGEAEKSQIYRGAVRAIRMAEDADQFYQSGLLDRGIKMYETSLTHFADAYCIQSRLAVQFASRGEFESAAKHYQRAFELMPTSFGRVESHCFGCEGVFTGKLAGDIAERIFGQLIADSPENPQVQYLMGYLYAGREQHETAIGYFQEAVRLDPDYLNAWKKVLESGKAGGLAPEQRDEAVFSMLRLDPLGRHETPDIAQVGDLERLWTVLASRPSKPALGDLLSLKASAAKLDSDQENSQYAEMRAYQYEVEAYDSDRGFASHGELAAIARLIDAASQ